MARKKASKPAATSASARTTAAVFNSLDAPEEKVEEVEIPTPPMLATEEDPDKPEDYKFPFNLIFEFQDFLNNYITVPKGVEILVVLYITQMAYLYLQKQDDFGAISAVGFNILGVTLAMYLSHRSLKNKHFADPQYVAYPELPEFNTLHAVAIPILMALLLGNRTGAFFQVNLALNNFAVRSLHPAAKVMSSFIFYYMYNENTTLEFLEFVQVLWIYYSVEWGLTYWNEREAEDGNVERSFAVSEIHLVAVIVVNLLANFHVELSEATIPLFILRELTISFIGACAVAFPVHYGYSLTLGIARSISGFGLIGAFCASFYLLMNYQFQQVVKQGEVIQWLVNFILASEARVQLLGAWVAALFTTAPIMFWLSLGNKISLNSRRKLWHFMLVGCLAYPAFIDEPVFTAIALVGSIFVFMAVEILRCTRLTFIGEFLHKHLQLFQDEKDLKGPLNLSYIFLLVGVSIPLLYGIAVDDVISIRSFIGLVTLGLGDSLASIVGKAYGKTKWKDGTRTLEGTITFIVVTFVGFGAVDYFILPEGHRVTNWENLFIVSILSGALEGASTLNDNILIPCMAVVSYELIGGVF